MKEDDARASIARALIRNIDFGVKLIMHEEACRHIIAGCRQQPTCIPPIMPILRLVSDITSMRCTVALTVGCACAIIMLYLRHHLRGMPPSRLAIHAQSSV